MKKHMTAGIAATAAAVMLMAGCTTDGEAIKQSDSAAGGSATNSAAAESAIDTGMLDTGGYPIEPRAPFGAVGDDRVVQWESQRMAQFVVLPFEVDPELNNVSMPTGVVSGPNGLKGVIAEGAGVPANQKLVAGFVATASTPDANLRQKSKRGMNNWVGRYLTPADAAAAAQQMADATAKDKRVRITTDPALPGTQLIESNSPGTDEGSLAAFTPRGVYVLYQWFGTRNDQKNLRMPAITRVVKQQAELIDKFPRTLTKDERIAKGIPRSPNIIDQNKVLIYALPYSDKELKENKTSVPSSMLQAVYGARGMALFTDNPGSILKMLNDVGAQYNAMDRSNVYRAKDDAGATTILDTFVSENKGTGLWKPTTSPRGLPIAPCFERAIGNGRTFYSCYVQKGRYVGEISSTQGLDDAHQLISAQYVILTKADQTIQP